MLLDRSIDKSHIPDRYNSTEITLMVKDPYWIYAYWDISNEVQYRAYAFGRPNWVLKVNHISSHTMANNTFYINVGQPIGNWYIYVNRPNSQFTAEIGIITSDGNFVSLAQSNAVHTPRDSVSDRINPYYMNIFDIQRKPHIQQIAKPWQSTGSEAYFGISSESIFNRS